MLGLDKSLDEGKKMRRKEREERERVREWRKQLTEGMGGAQR